MEKCEICGKEISRKFQVGQSNYYSLFGQKVCSDDCRLEQVRRQNKKAAEEWNKNFKETE